MIKQCRNQKCSAVVNYFSMPKGKPHNAKKKAAAIADLLTGDGVCEVAARYGLDKSVVSRWKAKIPAGELQRVATKKDADLDDTLFDCVKGSLESLAAQAKAAGDSDYLRKQSAKDLAMLHGVMFDKTFRLLEAAAINQPWPENK